MDARPANIVCGHGNIMELRELLARRFPHLRQTLPARKSTQVVATGVLVLDQLLGGGLPRGKFTELVALGNGSGSAEVIHQLLATVAAHRQFLALVDGTSSFDVTAVDPPVLSRLLWLRCVSVMEALKAVDLLLRDRNFPMLVVDLKLNAPRELRKVSSSIWFRYARLVEHNQTTVLLITPFALVATAAVRLWVKSALDARSLEQSRTEVLSGLRFGLLRTEAELADPVAAQAG